MSSRQERTQNLFRGSPLLPLIILLPLVLPLVPPTLASSSKNRRSHPAFSSNRRILVSQSTGENSPSSPDNHFSSESCQNPDASDASTGLKSHLERVAHWALQPKISISAVVQRFGPQLMAYLNPSPWPGINEQARLAKVPVIMYHDFLPRKEVFFDVTPQEFEQHLRLIQKNGLTPISLDQLVAHLRTGLPLPEKPILLTFDDGYGSHYQYVYPLLKKYGYPGAFSIYTLNIGKNTGRTHVTWDQLREMAADPLITISAHSVTHPQDVTTLPDDKLRMEIVESKRILESQLGIPIRYFTYPEGKYDARVEKFVEAAGYEAAMTMNDEEDRFAGQSKNLLAIDRIGQLKLQYAVGQAWGGLQTPSIGGGFDFTAPIKFTKVTVNKIPFMLASGGRPVTIHAKSRYQVHQILAGTQAVAGVDGGFFSMRLLDSNEMVGPVLSQNENLFIPGQKYENTKSTGRPLVLLSPNAVQFIPFDPSKHNTLAGIQAEMPGVTDAFIAAAWLVKNSQPQLPKSFGNLYGYNEARHRAFWGLNQSGQPVVGITTDNIDAVGLGAMLAKLGLRDAVMLDSGDSTSLAYNGKPLVVGYLPRPVPHVVALMGSAAEEKTCTVALR